MKLRYFWLRKIHSLLGVFPLGIFFVGWLVLLGGQSQEGYSRGYSFFLSLPYSRWMVVFLFWIPLILHGGLGLHFSYQTGIEVPRKGTRVAYFLYLLQSITGVMALGFFLFLLITFQLRAPGGLGGREYAKWFFERLQSHLTSSLFFALYISGFFAVIFHFCHGLWTFCKHWGLTISPFSRKIWGWFCAFLGGGLGLVTFRFLYLLSRV